MNIDWEAIVWMLAGFGLMAFVFYTAVTTMGVF